MTHLPRAAANVLEREFGIPAHTVVVQPLDGGVVGENVRVTFTEPQTIGSCDRSSVVVKMPAHDEEVRSTGMQLGAYEREVRFYEDLSQHLDIRTPECFGSHFDTSTGDFWLVLEDIKAAHPVDQVTGCSIPQAHRAIEQLAGLAAPRWGDPSLDDVGWLRRNRSTSTDAAVTLYEQRAESFLETFGGTLHHQVHDVVIELGERIRSWIRMVPEPVGLVHGDFRLDNLIYTADDVVTLDWQTVGHARPLGDVSYFLGGSLQAGVRRKSEDELLGVYRRALGRRGVTMSADACWEEYRLFSLSGVATVVIAATSFDSSASWSQELFHTLIERHVAHAVDMKALELVDR